MCMCVCCFFVVVCVTERAFFSLVINDHSSGSCFLLFCLDSRNINRQKLRTDRCPPDHCRYQKIELEFMHCNLLLNMCVVKEHLKTGSHGD